MERVVKGVCDGRGGVRELLVDYDDCEGVALRVDHHGHTWSIVYKVGDEYGALEALNGYVMDDSSFDGWDGLMFFRFIASPSHSLHRPQSFQPQWTIHHITTRTAHLADADTTTRAGTLLIVLINLVNVFRRINTDPLQERD